MSRPVAPSPARRRRFIAEPSALLGAFAVGMPATAQRKARPEKETLTFGFIKLTDCVPLVVAYEKHYFEDEGLHVSLEAQANWSEMKPLLPLEVGKVKHPIKADVLSSVKPQQTIP